MRIIAATNKDLKEEVQKKNFRNDLYFRLKVISFYIPPLTERRDDVKALIEYYLKYYNKLFHKNIKKVSKEAMEVFIEYNWPGNVRELKNVFERIVLLEEEDTVALRHIPLEMLTLPDVIEKASIFSKSKKLDTRAINSLDKVEKMHIISTLSSFQNNKTKTAKALGISRKTLWDKLKKYEIDEKNRNRK